MNNTKDTSYTFADLVAYIKGNVPQDILVCGDPEMEAQLFLAYADGDANTAMFNAMAHFN